MTTPSEEQIKEYDCETGFAEVRRLQASYDKFIVGLKRQVFIGGRSTVSQMVGGLEMTPEAILGIEESTRRWCGGGTYYATVHNGMQQPLMRLKYEILGEPRPYRGPGADKYEDDGNDIGIVHLPSLRRAQTPPRPVQPAPIAPGTPPDTAAVTILDRTLQQQTAQRADEQARRDRENADLRREMQALRDQHTQLLERSARERAEAEQANVRTHMERLQQELQELRRARETPAQPARQIDWVGVATALAAPFATVTTALITAGTERQKAVLTAQQQAPQNKSTVLAELKELLALPFAKPFLENMFGANKSPDDRIAMLDTLAEQNLAYVTMWRDMMRELEPKGDPVAVQVTRMIGEGLGQIAQQIERMRAGAAPQLQQGQQPMQQQAQPQQQPAAEEEHKAEVVEKEPAEDSPETAFATFPEWMKTREWWTILQQGWEFDREVIRSEQIDMMAQLTFHLVQHGVRFKMLPPELGAPTEAILQELAALLIPWNEDHATALFRALMRLFASAKNRSEAGPSIVTPRPQERIGEPGQVVPIR